MAGMSRWRWCGWGCVDPGVTRGHSVAAFLHLPPPLSALPLGPRGNSMAGQGMGRVFACEVLPAYLGPPEPPFFLLYPQSSPGSSKNPKTRLVCREAWPPLCVRPRVTPSHE